MSAPLLDISNSIRCYDDNDNENAVVEYRINTKRRKRSATTEPHLENNLSATSLLRHLTADELVGTLSPLLPQIEATFATAIVERVRSRRQWRSPPPFVLDCLIVFLDVAHRLRLRSLCKDYVNEFRTNAELWRGTRFLIKPAHFAGLTVMLPRIHIRSIRLHKLTKALALNGIQLIAPLSFIRSLTLTNVTNISVNTLLLLRHITELRIWRSRLTRTNGSNNENEQIVLLALTYFHFTESLEANDLLDESASALLRILPQTLLSLEIRYTPRQYDEQLVQRPLPSLTYLDISLHGGISRRQFQRDDFVPRDAPLKHIAITPTVSAATIQQLCEMESLISLHTHSQTLHVAHTMFSRLCQLSRLQELSIEHDEHNDAPDWRCLQLLHSLRVLRWKSLVNSATKVFLQCIINETDVLQQPASLLSSDHYNNHVTLHLDFSECDDMTHKIQIFDTLLSHQIVSPLRYRLEFITLPLFLACTPDHISRFQKSGLTLLRKAPPQIVRRCGCSHTRDCDHIALIEQSTSINNP